MDSLSSLREKAMQIGSPHIILGIDPYSDKIPPYYLKKNKDFVKVVEEWAKDLFLFGKGQIIGIKFQSAFFELIGPDGIKLCYDLIRCAKEEYDYFIILDVKRNDIPDVSGIYAQTYLSNGHIDAITTTPYFGLDSLDMFIKFAKKYDKMVFVVIYSSNKGAMDFQKIKTTDKEFWEEILYRISISYKSEKHLGFVAGATNPIAVRKVQETFPDSWILSPGFGPQGADVNSWKRVYLKPVSNVLFSLSRTLTVPDPIGHYTSRKMYFDFVESKIKEWKMQLQPLYEFI